jgi:hypothetical protein
LRLLELTSRGFRNLSPDVASFRTRSLERFFAGLPEGATVILTTASDVSRFRGLPAAVLRMTAGVSAAGAPRAAAGTGKGT